MMKRGRRMSLEKRDDFVVVVFVVVVVNKHTKVLVPCETRAQRI